jgi:hypothetical protein
MRFSKPRKVAQYQLFTVSGKALYGPIYRTKQLPGTLPNYCYGKDIDSQNAAHRKAKAEERTGEPCEWRRIEDAEMMGVQF